MWDRLKAPPKEQLDKFVNLHEGIEGVWQHPILNELTSMKDRLKAAVAAQDSQGGHQSRGAVEPPKG
jgi:hypothetical protein